MNLLSIDYNTYSCSYALWHGAEYQLCGSIVEREKPTKVVLQLGRVLEEYEIDTIAIEKIFIGVNHATAAKLAQMQGAIVWEAARRDIEVLQIPVTRWKSRILGTTKAGKLQSLESANGFLGKERFLTDHNEADAVNIGRFVVNEKEQEKVRPI